MKEVVHEFGVEKNWTEEMAKAMGGYMDGHYFVIPHEVHEGLRYVLSVNNDITVMLADVLYNQDIVFKLRNSNNDFIGVYFNLTDGASTHIFNNERLKIGRQNYNIAIVDSDVDLDYLVKTGTQTYNLCIFIKKSLANDYLNEAGVLARLRKQIFDCKKNTIIHYNLMSDNCVQLINEFRKKDVQDETFDLLLSGLVYSLLGDYMDQLIKREIIIGKLNSDDFSNIIQSQEFLTINIKEVFPGIELLAQRACMSKTKYKEIYKKVTGLTPNRFFMNNKLELARELLVSNHYGIGELAAELNFSSASNLAANFKKYFGLLPSDYIAQI